MHPTTYDLLARQHIQAMQREAQADAAASTIPGRGQPAIPGLVARVVRALRRLAAWSNHAGRNEKASSGSPATTVIKGGVRTKLGTRS
jgi:hypothetical protein